MKITIKESTMVQPMEETQHLEHIWLSNLDLSHGRSHVVPLAYLYKPNGSSNFFETKVLKEALSKVLVPFYPVAGRLGKDKNGRLEIQCNNKGVLFTEAEADSTMDELGDFLRDDVHSFLVPKVDYSKDISSFPLLVLQVTKFRCGGVSLGFGWHHLLGDGLSTMHFSMSWSSIARGLRISTPPSIDRTILRCRSPPTPKFPHIEYDEPPTLNYTSPEGIQNQTDSDANYLEIFEIKPEQLDALKAKIKGNDSKTNYTIFEILTAHIWRCASSARGLADDQETKLYLSVDGRNKFNPPLPSGYFGNVIFFATPIALSGDLLSEPMTDTVERIHKTLKVMDDEYLRSAIDYMEEIDDLTRVKTSKSPNLKIISWTRIPFFESHDFGWGKPISMRASNPAEGKGHILSCPSGDGSLLLQICLATHQIPTFKKLFYDFYVSKL